MTEIRHKNAVIRIHGSVNQEQAREATIAFVKKALKSQKEKK